MEEITIKIPKGLPGPYLKKKIDDLVKGELFGPVVSEVLAEIDAAMVAVISAGIASS